MNDDPSLWALHPTAEPPSDADRAHAAELGRLAEIDRYIEELAMLNERERADLDNYITGHGGEAQFRNPGRYIFTTQDTIRPAPAGQWYAEVAESEEAEALHRTGWHATEAEAVEAAQRWLAEQMDGAERR